jgi:hypothetical protein
MANQRALDPDNFASEDEPETAKGHDLRSLGPSDSSDSGSDLVDAGASVGDLDLDSTSDRNGTGERLAAGEDPEVRVGGDIAPDRIVGPEEAGLGGGLDEAEEARRR